MTNDNDKAGSTNNKILESIVTILIMGELFARCSFLAFSHKGNPFAHAFSRTETGPTLTSQEETCGVTARHKNRLTFGKYHLQSSRMKARDWHILFLAAPIGQEISKLGTTTTWFSCTIQTRSRPEIK